MPTTPPRRCLIKSCNHELAFGGPSLARGLCNKCYKRAKDMVESGQTTWDKLEAMGLSKPQDDDPFTDAFNKAITKES